MFAYDDGYLRGEGPPVATTLPLSPEPVVTHAAGALPPFFSGLLPEGRRLSALRAAAKTSADDELTLLLAVGGETVGDVQVLPEGEEPGEVEPRVTVEAWSEVRFADLFRASVGGGDGIDRVAIPGVQDKVSARMIDVPVARENARFVLKLDPPEFPHLVANEAFFLEAARRSGLECAEAEVVRDAEGAPGLLVRRFDRLADASGGVTPLAQEDACQVLARYPADKYRLTTESVVGGLAAVCRAAPVAAPRPPQAGRLRLPLVQRRRPRQELLRAAPSRGRMARRRPPTTCPRPTRTATRPWRSPSTARTGRTSDAPTSWPWEAPRGSGGEPWSTRWTSWSSAPTCGSTS